VLDGDEAGQRRTNEVLELFVAAQVDLRIMTLPDELDPAEFVVERGGEAFREQLAAATDALEHKIRIATRGIDLVRDTHRANQALEDILSTIARGLPPGSMDSANLRAHQLLARLSRQFQLEDGDVRSRFAQLRRSVKTRVDAPEQSPSEPTFKLSTLSPCECELIEILDLHPELAPVALAEIADEDLSSEAAREIIRTYRTREEAGQSLDFVAVLGDVENASLKSLLVELDERAHEKSPKAILGGPERLRSVVRTLRQQHEARELRQTEMALEQNVFQPEEELNVLSQMIAARRRQQGLTAPMEG
jgi:DNA primase